MSLPTEEQASQFAVMVHAGLPPSEAVQYFVTTEDPKELNELTRKWQRSRLVGRALSALMGKAWQAMSLEERCRYALDQHYSQLAYILYSNHYAEAALPDKNKLDTARTAIEAKLAGTAGKGDALSQFFDDVRSGRVKLAKPISMPAQES
jgi:hypothetical protein